MSIIQWLENHNHDMIPVVTDDEFVTEEPKMAYVKQEISTERDESLEYIRNRVREIYYAHNRKLEEAFEDPRPKTFKEAQEWLASGNFRVAKPAWMEHCDDDEEVHSTFFHWGKTAPAKETKEEAFSALHKAWTDTKDTCTILTDEQARLKAVKDFESATFYTNT